MRTTAISSLLVMGAALAGCESFDTRPLTDLTTGTRPGAAAYSLLLERCPVNPSVGNEGGALAIVAGAVAPLLANFAVEEGLANAAVI